MTEQPSPTPLRLLIRELYDQGRLQYDDYVGLDTAALADSATGLLDVERLREALRRYSPPPAFEAGVRVANSWSRPDARDAEAIAAEYVRLASQSSGASDE